jgi:aminoglycoside 6'-N-acetyltransferase
MAATEQHRCVELTGSQVLLRPITTDNIGSLSLILHEPEVTRWWGDFDRERIARELVNNDDPATTVYVIEVKTRVAGLIQCYEEPDAQYRTAAIDIAVGREWQGRGVAVDAIRTLARHLIDHGGHHHLTIDPAAANTRAIACYTKVGFRPVGVLRQNERGRDGSFHDTLLMDLLAGELT